MNKHKQQGSHHIVVISGIAISLSIALGFLFWQNIANEWFLQNADIGKEYKLSTDQKVAIGGTRDTFVITGFTYCSSDALCLFGNTVYFKIKDDKGVSWDSDRQTRWRVEIIKTDYRTYAIVRFSHKKT